MIYFSECKHMVIICEAPKCDKCIIIPAGPSIAGLGERLQQKGWSWLRGDEAYDHVCSKECLEAFDKAENEAMYQASLERRT